jgi:hypothetical protein
MFIPVAVGCVAGVVWPAAIVTLAGEIASFVGSLLSSVTVTPPVGAGEPRLTVTGTDALSPTLRLAGRLMAPGAVTVILAVAFGMFGVVVEAVIVAEPGATGVTATFTLVWFAGMVTEAGTVDTPVLDDDNANVTGAGAGTESVSERLCAPVPVTMVAVPGKKLADPVTFTVVLAGA